MERPVEAVEVIPRHTQVHCLEYGYIHICFSRLRRPSCRADVHASLLFYHEAVQVLSTCTRMLLAGLHGHINGHCTPVISTAPPSHCLYIHVQRLFMYPFAATRIIHASTHLTGHTSAPSWTEFFFLLVTVYSIGASTSSFALSIVPEL